MENSENFIKFAQLIKVDEETHMTWGIVTSEKPDKDDEICSYPDAKKAYKKWSDDFLDKTTAAGQEPSMGNVRVMHGLQIGGKVIKLEFKDDEKQVWLGTQPANDSIWKLIKGGFITGLSQGGKYLWKKKEGDYTRYAPTIVEVSYVDSPALDEASFAYVKSDGSMEMRKFADPSTGPSDPELRKLWEEIRMNKSEKCSCKCANCAKGDCANCSGETKCSASKNAVSTSKAVKYLVNRGEEKHLPYTDEDGKISRRLLGAAWAALHEGYRGNKYEGSDKEKARKKIKQIYAANAWDTPTEKAVILDELIKNTLIDTINNRAFGQLNKGCYTVSRFAELAENLKYLWMAIENEREFEGDESPVTDDLKETLVSFLEQLLDYTSEQVEEELAVLHGEE